MISALYRPDGSVETVTVDFYLLDPEDQADMLAWTRAHGIEPRRVRTPAEIGYDPATDEWIFELFVRGPGDRGIRFDPVTLNVMMRRVRRRVRRDLPFVATETKPGGGS